MKYYKVPGDQLRDLLKTADLLTSLKNFGVCGWERYYDSVKEHTLALEARMNIEQGRFEESPDFDHRNLVKVVEEEMLNYIHFGHFNHGRVMDAVSRANLNE